MRLWRRRNPRINPAVAQWILAAREGGPDRMTIDRDGVSYSYSEWERRNQA